MKRDTLFKQLSPFMLISWRNLWRQKRRSLVVISSIGIGIFAMMVSMSFSNGMMVQMVDNTIGTSLGDTAVHRQGFQNSMKLRYNFVPGRRMMDLLGKNGKVRSFAPRVKVKGMIRSSEASRGVMIVGIDPAREKNVSTVYHYTIRKEGGRYLSGPSSDEILISKTLAEKLDLYIGDKAVLMFQDKNNEIAGIGLQIVGLFETPMGRFDKSVVFMGIGRLQALTGIGSAVSELTVMTSDEKSVREVRDSLERGIHDSGLEILSWMDMAPNLVSMIQLINVAMVIFFMIIFITVIFSIANTLIMSIVERFHELGVMKSIGTRPSYIFFMVIFEAINLGMVGLAAGVAFGIPVIMLLGYTGIDMSFAADSIRKWGTGSVIYPMVRPGDIATAAAVVLITTVIASLYPAFKAARIKPLDALSYT